MGDGAWRSASCLSFISVLMCCLLRSVEFRVLLYAVWRALALPGIREAAEPADVLYDVLYDEPFEGGLALRCSAGRGYKMPPFSLMNVSHGLRRKFGQTGQPVTAAAPASSGNQSHTAALGGDSCWYWGHSANAWSDQKEAEMLLFFVLSLVSIVWRSKVFLFFFYFVGLCENMNCSNDCSFLHFFAPEIMLSFLYNRLLFVSIQLRCDELLWKHRMIGTP